MPDTKPRHASCLCGALRLTARGAPRDVYLCACRSCRKKSGSAFTHAAIFRAEEVSVEGAPGTFRYRGESGRWIENNFCTACGGYLFFRAEVFPRHIGVNAGAVAEDVGPPRRMYWASRRPGWLCVPEGVEAVETQ